MSKNLETLEGSFRALGWSESEIKKAVSQVQANPKKMTVVMPEHYKKEAETHAKNTCKFKHGLKEGSKDYAAYFKHHYNEFLTSAYNNSRGIDEEDSDGDMQANPTTPRAVAAFETSIFEGVDNPYKRIVDKLENSTKKEDQKNAEKFKKMLKSGGMTLAHVYLEHVGGLVNRNPTHPEKSIYSPPTSYQFLAHQLAGLNDQEREKFVREIGNNNFIRQILLTSILKIVEPVFKVNFAKMEALTKEKMSYLPASTYHDKYWLKSFIKVLERNLRNDMKDFNLENIVADSFKTLNDVAASLPEIAHIQAVSQPAPVVALKDPNHSFGTPKEALYSIFGGTSESGNAAAMAAAKLAGKGKRKKDQLVVKPNDLFSVIEVKGVNQFYQNGVYVGDNQNVYFLLKKDPNTGFKTILYHGAPVNVDPIYQQQKNPLRKKKRSLWC